MIRDLVGVPYREFVFMFVAGFIFCAVLLTVINYGFDYEERGKTMLACDYAKEKYGTNCVSGGSCVGAVHLFLNDLNWSRNFTCFTSYGKAFVVGS